MKTYDKVIEGIVQYEHEYDSAFVIEVSLWNDMSVHVTKQWGYWVFKWDVMKGYDILKWEDSDNVEIHSTQGLISYPSPDTVKKVYLTDVHDAMALYRKWYHKAEGIYGENYIRNSKKHSKLLKEHNRSIPTDLSKMLREEWNRNVEKITES